MSGEVLSGLVMIARVNRACTVEAVILMGSDMEEVEEDEDKGKEVAVGVEAVEEFSSF